MLVYCGLFGFSFLWPEITSFFFFWCADATLAVYEALNENYYHKETVPFHSSNIFHILGIPTDITLRKSKFHDLLCLLLLYTYYSYPSIRSWDVEDNLRFYKIPLKFSVWLHYTRHMVDILKFKIRMIRYLGKGKEIKAQQCELAKRWSPEISCI